MAIGDVVSGFSASSTVLSFQPAVGVECVITSFAVYQGWIRAYNGTVTALLHYNDYTSDQGRNINAKIFINNTNYIRLDIAGSTTYSMYSGIVTK